VSKVVDFPPLQILASKIFYPGKWLKAVFFIAGCVQGWQGWSEVAVSGGKGEAGMRKSETPGLKHRGARLVWVAPAKAIAAGFIPKTLDLSDCPPAELPSRCQRLWQDAHSFSGPPRALAYDGGLASLLKLYEMHEASPFRKVKPGTARIYLDRLTRAYGKRLVSKLTGLDVHRWHKDWREAPAGEREHLGAAAMVLAILKAALGFGQSCGFRDCRDLRDMLRTLRLPAPKAREEAPDAEVFAYALQFETAVRQNDVVGLWVPMDDPRPSSILASRSK
jgi:hypothetical protein